MNGLMVTVRCVTYNHEAYIRRCLDGFVMQKTGFRFEAIVHDDASTDGTAAIIREYARKYPEIIKPIYETENQYSKHDGSLRRIMDANTHGKYVAFCEGDDYWTDPYKLQKQVDFLETHPEFVMCSHRFNQYIQETGVMVTDDDADFHGAEYDLENLICGRWYTQTLTVMYRRDALDREQYDKYSKTLDITLFYTLLRNGKGYCLPDVMAVYRVHSGGVWSEVSMDRRRLIEFEARLAIYDVEKSGYAAMFILCQFYKAISRAWMLKESKMFVRVFGILARHYGYPFVARLMFSKMILGMWKTWDQVGKVKYIKRRTDAAAE